MTKDPSSPKRRALITGGDGFIGRHLTSALRARGWEASSFDLRRGDDICEPISVERAVREADVVVHLAAYADLYRAKADPVGAVRVNVLGTSIVAEACRRHGVRLVHGSTACVYGNQPSYPCDESARPNPSEIYAQTKLAAEQVVTGLVDSLALNAVIVRFPGVYGENLRSSLAVARFIERALRDSALEVHGDGSQTRTPIHVSDLVRGLVEVVEHSAVRGVINLGSHDEISALELARMINRMVGRGRIEHVAQRLPQTWRECVDWSRAKRLLGWEPLVRLEEGLCRTIEWWLTSHHGASCETRLSQPGQAEHHP